MPRDEFGDFQTPADLVKEVYRVLAPEEYDRILEPTCGIGNFLQIARSIDLTTEIQGVELQQNYADIAEKHAKVTVADAMQIDFAELSWTSSGRLLVVGNPPWVTNADLTTMDSANKPVRRNIRGLKGMDAMTGSSNFDIAESIFLKLIAELADQKPTIALLCKTQVARNVLSYGEQFALPFVDAAIYEIDAMKWFGAGVDACLFVINLDTSKPKSYIADVYSSLGEASCYKRVGVIDGKLVSDVDKYLLTRAADGISQFSWRQGIKHDATMAMELINDPHGPRKKSGELVDIESDHLFPLLKCTDVFRGRTGEVTKWMVVPQRHTSDDTRLLEHTSPQTWSYLVDHADILDNRKSSIYRNRARFCIFGVGPYSFAPYKVAISAMHKQPVFRLVGPLEGRPVVFDDVTYFASFETAEAAAVATSILTSAPTRALLESLTFTDSKRPITKKLLQRLDILALAALSDEASLLASALAAAAEAGLAVEPQTVAAELHEIVAPRNEQTSPSLFDLEAI